MVAAWHSLWLVKDEALRAHEGWVLVNWAGTEGW